MQYNTENDWIIVQRETAIRKTNDGPFVKASANNNVGIVVHGPEGNPRLLVGTRILFPDEHKTIILPNGTQAILLKPDQIVAILPEG